MLLFLCPPGLPTDEMLSYPTGVHWQSTRGKTPSTHYLSPWCMSLSLYQAKSGDYSAILKYISWELQDLFHILPTFHARRNLYFFQKTPEEMFENGRVRRVGTIKHVGFLRNAGLKDLRICISSNIWYQESIGHGDCNRSRDVEGDNSRRKHLCRSRGSWKDGSENGKWTKEMHF